MNQHATEVMLELGLAKSLAGTAYLDDKVLPKYAAAYRSVPVLAAEYPSYEKLLAGRPRLRLRRLRLGLRRGRGARPRSPRQERHQDPPQRGELPPGRGATTMDDVYEEVTRGRPHLRGARAGGGVDDSRPRPPTRAYGGRRLRAGRRCSVFVYDSGDKTAFTVGGKGIGNDIVTRAGGRNVFADDLKDGLLRRRELGERGGPRAGNRS